MDSVTTLIYSATWLTGVAVTYAIFCLYVACMRWRCFKYSNLFNQIPYLILIIITIIKMIITIINLIITRGSSLDRDLDGFPLNQVEVDQRGHDQAVIGGDGDIYEFY